MARVASNRKRVPVSCSALSARCLFAAFNDQLIVDAEGTRHFACPQARHSLVTLRVNNTEQRDAAVFHDDVNRVVACRFQPWKCPPYGRNGPPYA